MSKDKIYESLNLVQTKIKPSINALKALKHPLKLEILAFIHNFTKTQGFSPTQSQIHEGIGEGQSLTSRHTSFLQKIGVVTALKKGRHIRKSINYIRLKELIEILEKI